jgi:hypothetical protein
VVKLEEKRFAESRYRARENMTVFPRRGAFASHDMARVEDGISSITGKMPHSQVRSKTVNVKKKIDQRSRREVTQAGWAPQNVVCAAEEAFIYLGSVNDPYFMLSSSPLQRYP